MKQQKLNIISSLYLDNELYDDNIDDEKKPKPFANNGVISLKRQTETGEALQDLNATGKDSDSKMHKEDKRTQTTTRQASGLTRLDVLCEMGVIPPEVHVLSTQAKRNFMSISGWRAEQMVRTAIGINDKQQGKGILSKMGGLFTKNESEGVK